VGSISAFGEPASRFTQSAIERSGKWKKVIATAWAQFGATEKRSINV
jgi:hypothetical protein